MKKKSRAPRQLYIYIYTGVRRKNGGGSCRRGGAHPMPWLLRGAPKRHRRERTATEVAPPHSPHAAPRLTLHVPPHHILTDVLKKKVVRFASIIYNFYCGIVVISLRHRPYTTPVYTIPMSQRVTLCICQWGDTLDFICHVAPCLSLAFIRCVKQGHEARTSASIWGRHVESVT